MKSIGETLVCPKCNANLKGEKYSRLIGVEYSFRDPYHYDGVSEWLCPDCGYREGRWSRLELKDFEKEQPPRSR